MELTLIRHGQTDLNVAGQYQGWTDAPLNSHGIWQAVQVVNGLNGRAIERVVSSDLIRAVETARPFSEAIGLPIEQDGRLREVNFGEWEGLTYDEIMRHSPDVARRYFSNPAESGAPGGEQFSEVVARTQAVLDEIVAADVPTVVFGHGGSLRLLLCHLLTVPPHLYWQFKLTHGSITTLDVYDVGARLRQFNDTLHISLSNPKIDST